MNFIDWILHVRTFVFYSFLSFSMSFHVKCCCCVDLELGGKIWGWVGLICGVLCALLSSFFTYDAYQNGEVFSSLDKQKVKLTMNFSANVFGYIEAFGIFLAVATAIASSELITAIKQVKPEQNLSLNSSYSISSIF